MNIDDLIKRLSEVDIDYEYGDVQKDEKAISDAITMLATLRTLLAQALPKIKYIADQEIYKGSIGELVDQIEEALK